MTTQFSPRIGTSRLALLLLIATFPVALAVRAAAAPAKDDSGAAPYAIIYIAEQQPTLLSDTQQRPKEGDPNIYQRTHMAYVRSRFVLNKALAQPKIANLDVVKQQKDPIAWLEKNLEVDSFGSPELIRISLSGTNREELATLINAVVDSYMDEVQATEDKARQDRKQKITQLYQRYDSMLRHKRETLEYFLAASGAVTVNKSSKLQQDDLSAYEKERRRVLIARVAARARLEAEATEKKDDPRTEETRRQLKKEIAVFNAQEKLLNVEIELLIARLKADDRLNNDIASTREEVESLNHLVKRLRNAAAEMDLEMNAPKRVILKQKAEGRSHR